LNVCESHSRSSANSFPPPNALHLQFRKSSARATLQVHLTPGNLAGLDRAHLGNPSLRRLELAHSPDLVGCVAGDADVVVALEDELDVANLERLGAASFGALAGCGDDLVDEFVGYGEDALGQC